MTIRFVRSKKSYWGEPPLGCECGAILPVRAEKVRAGSGVTCTKCNAFVTFDAWDVETIAAEILRLRTTPKKTETKTKPDAD